MRRPFFLSAATLFAFILLLSGILNAGVVVRSPNGGETWAIGTTNTVSWIITDLDGEFRIYLVKGGRIVGSDPIHTFRISPSSPAHPRFGSYRWEIPTDVEQGTDYRIRIVHGSGPKTVSDESNGNFAIVGSVDFSGVVNILSPTAGEHLVAGTTYDIRWSATGVEGNPYIDILRDGRVVLRYGDDERVYAVRIGDQWRWSWSIPLDLSRGLTPGYKVRVLYGRVFGESGEFAVTARPIVVTAPREGETLFMTHQHYIRWTTSLSGPFNIFLMRGSRAVQTIARSVEGNNYRWIVGLAEERLLAPPETRNEFTIWVQTADYRYRGESGAFYITSPSIRVLSPNGRESFRWNRDIYISWTTNQMHGPVFIELWFGDRRDTVIIQNHIGTNYTFRYCRPGHVYDCARGSSFKIRVGSAYCPLIFDESDNYFTIER